MAPAPVTSWREVQAAEDAAVRSLARDMSCDRARQILPLLTAEQAAPIRRAMLARSDDLPQLLAPFGRLVVRGRSPALVGDGRRPGSWPDRISATAPGAGQ